MELKYAESSLLSLIEHRFLKWVDLIELLRLRFELLDCFTDLELQDRLQDCLTMADLVTDQTERLAQTGILLYLQDTCATRLSSYGTILYKVSISIGCELKQSSFSGNYDCINNGPSSTCSKGSIAFAARLPKAIQLQQRLL